MSWLITPRQPVAVDPYFSSVSLLLHGNGTNGSTSIIDSSPSPKTVTAFGNAQISTAQSKFDGASIAFDGSGDYLTATSPNLLQDWTIEMWIYPTVGNLQQTLISLNDGAYTGVNFWMNPSRQLVADNGQTSQQPFTGGVLTLNQWQLVALAKSNNTTTGYIGGSPVGSNSFVPLPVSQIVVGAHGRFGQGSFFNGYQDEIRLTNGIARYQSAFTPPTAPFPDA